MKYIKIKDWERWQKWKPGKNRQAWIQLWTNLFSNEDWLSLSDSEKGQLVSMWIAAADKQGQLPKCPEIIRKMAYLDNAPDLFRFKQLGWIEGNLDENANENESDSLSKKNKANINKEKLKDTLSGKPDIFSAVIDYLNRKSGKHYRVTENHKKFMKARINEGFNFSDFQKVIDNMVILWKSDKDMERYLRPSTLFGNNMDGYKNVDPLTKDKTKMEEAGETLSSWLKKSERGDYDKDGIFKGDGDTDRLGPKEAGGNNSGSLVPNSKQIPDGGLQGSDNKSD